jgi:hypothetical protein
MDKIEALTISIFSSSNVNMGSSLFGVFGVIE